MQNINAVLSQYKKLLCDRIRNTSCHYYVRFIYRQNDGSKANEEDSVKKLTHFTYISTK